MLYNATFIYELEKFFPECRGHKCKKVPLVTIFHLPQLHIRKSTECAHAHATLNNTGVRQGGGGSYPKMYLLLF